ncbi:MAG TPA: SLBB domain-containing protein [bacterium]|nr:SLBB domain-containing protein [bacterium]HNT65266.1 SLBB domain-containing protein [bacterium]HOX86931.1 SLBB domain-containing protein [bacterium]HPG46262.1 SLBB domain-containing protein [bacterium]HPM98544.1 SLBB domain-containing protein [bacterium]
MQEHSAALQKIRAAGVVGAGGAGFPTYKKLDAQVDHIIANGAECEPLMYKDREVLLQEKERLLEGLSIMQRITGAKKVTIAIKRKNSDVANLLDADSRRLGFTTFIMEDVYPAGDEYILVYDITGRLIPPGGLPLQVGALVQNVETIVNIARAMAGEPVTDKFVTVTGAVDQAITVRIPIGTRFSDCLALAGGATVSHPLVFTGGIMMGGVETDLSMPVVKTNGGLIFLPTDHPVAMRKLAPAAQYLRIGHSCCDQCSMCTELCPRYLLGYPIEPHKVMRSLLMTGDDLDRISLWAAYCCECNVCSLFACPEKLDPKNICADAKKRLRENGLSRTPDELAALSRDVHPVRSGREVPITMLYQRLGLKPYDRKAHFLETNFVPAEVELPLQQHIGAAAVPVVKSGDTVVRGQLIADVPGEKLGCPVHASISGRISKVQENSIIIKAE